MIDKVALWKIPTYLPCFPPLQAGSPEVAVEELRLQSAEVSEIVFFLLGAMTIVEIVDAHQGFRIVTDSIRTRDFNKLLWIVPTLSSPPQPLTSP